jgi:hypothetical protein
MRPVDSRTRPAATAEEPLVGVSNYLIGSDREGWRTHIPHFGRVRFEQVYSGIDLTYYGSEGRLEYDFLVQPGADPAQIRLAFEGIESAAIVASGDLQLALAEGDIVQKAPLVHQETRSGRRQIDGHFELHGDRLIGFRIGDYDVNLPLVIDPVLVFSTHLGGSVEDSGQDVVVDGDGNVLVVGTTESADFPTKDPYDSTLGGNRDAFIAKLSADGSALLYSTFLGGSGNEYGREIDLDPRGNIYIAGSTNSSDFPTVNAVDPVNSGTSEDAFITKLDPTGSTLVFSTYLGGEEKTDIATGIAVDDTGNAYVTGETWSSDFPTANAWQPDFSHPGVPYSYDVIVAKLPPTGTPLTYSTFLGGADSGETGRDIDVDASGNAYVTGRTWSTDFPTLNAMKPAYTYSGSGAFVTKLSATGSVVYSTYFGGSSSETGEGIAVDDVGNTYLTGVTTSTDFPTKNAFQGTYQGEGDAFVTKLEPDGSAIIQSTYLGGSDDIDVGYAIAIDKFGGAYVTGKTVSSDFPTVWPFDGQSTADVLEDAFLARLSPDGSELLYSTYLEGTNGTDIGHGIALGKASNVLVTGITWSSDFPTYRPLQPANLGTSNAWIMRWQWPMDFWIATTALPSRDPR